MRPRYGPHVTANGTASCCVTKPAPHGLEAASPRLIGHRVILMMEIEMMLQFNEYLIGGDNCSNIGGHWGGCGREPSCLPRPQHFNV